MDIKTIRLQNFRGFRDASIELKPLTVLLGPNSAGKSAFGHALASMAHAHKLYAAGAPGPVTLTPPIDYADTWPVDLGHTSDLRTSGAKGPVCIGLQTANGDWLELGFGGLKKPSDLLLSYILHPSEQSPPSSTPTNPTIVSREQSASTVFPIQAAIVKSPDAQGGVVYAPHEPTGAPIELTRLNEQQWQDEWSVTTKGLNILTVEHKTGAQRILSNAARKSLLSLLENLTYLRATRKRPSRGYLDNVGKQQPIGYSGEWAPSIIHNKSTKQVTYCAPPKIPNSVDEARKNDSEWKVKNQTLLKGVGAWLSHLGLATAIETIPPSLLDSRVKLRATIKSGQESHDITEIGFGVSQVIPILAAGLFQPKDSLLIVDLPEAHLHPRPQGELADFFCSLALSGKSAIVETHSEMFFHRLRLRAAQNPSLMDKIAVYFIDRPVDGLCCKPRLVNLGYEGELQWPEGFLQEAWETESQINAVREAQRLASE